MRQPERGLQAEHLRQRHLEYGECWDYIATDRGEANEHAVPHEHSVHRVIAKHLRPGALPTGAAKFYTAMQRSEICGKRARRVYHCTRPGMPGKSTRDPIVGPGRSCFGDARLFHQERADERELLAHRVKKCIKLRPPAGTRSSRWERVIRDRPRVPPTALSVRSKTRV